jgi:HAD superfamily hydrolase (TIGR01662 family)
MEYFALDFDGTILKNAWYQSDDFDWNCELIEKLQILDKPIVIISNQKGILLGYQSQDEFIDKVLEVFQIFEEFEIKILGFYFCPNDGAKAIFIDKNLTTTDFYCGENGCYYFRKPSIGMGKECEKNFGKPIAYIGDMQTDRLFGETLRWQYYHPIQFIDEYDD